MRRFLIGLTAALCLCARIPAALGESVYMRVVARDDSPAAQQEKIEVRDAVLALCPNDPACLNGALPTFADAAKTVTRDIEVELRAWAPDEKTPPALTVYITIGAGDGHNWWGVLYEDALTLAAQEETETATDEVTFYWPFLSWLLHLLGI